MNRSNNEIVFLLRIICDLLMTCLSWVIAYYLRFYSVLDTPRGIPPGFLYWKLIPFIIMIWLFGFTASGFYKRSGKHHSPLTEGLDIIQTSVITLMVFTAFTFFYEYRYSRMTLVFFATLNPLAIIAGRSMVRKIMRRYIKHTRERAILLIGADDILRHAISLIRKPSMERVKIFGAILLPSEKSYAADFELCQKLGIEVFPLSPSWGNFFVEHPTDTVYIAMPQKAYGYFEDNITRIADQVADIKLIPDIIKYTRFSAGIDLVAGIPVIAIHDSPLHGLGSVAKRLIDFFGSTVGIVLLSPIMLIIGILVPLSSRGPILYRQERMGLDGRKFDCLKFRSMPVDVEQKSGAVWAKADDNRATSFGSFLRRTSLDELPQLFNVFKGEMSLVGPRPERPVFVNKFRNEVPGYMLRHKVKAGITGWAQVNGWRGNTSIEKRIEYDLHYIQNWSVWFDIKIIILTIEEVLVGRNAY